MEWLSQTVQLDSTRQRSMQALVACCSDCGYHQLVVIDLPASAHLHYQCGRCGAVACGGGGRCARAEPRWSKPTADALADYPPPPDEGGRTA